MPPSTVVALLGATGAVGAEVLRALRAHPMPFQVDGYGGPTHASDDDEDPVYPLGADESLDADVVILATPAALTGTLAARVEDGVIVDLSGTLDAPIILDADQAPSPTHVRLAGPVAAAVAPLLRALGPLGLTHAHLTTLLPASTDGRDALDELRDQAVALLSFRDPPTRALGRRLAFDAQPADAHGLALAAEVQALVPGPRVTAQAVQIGAFIGTGVALRLQFGAPVDRAAVDAVVATQPGLVAHAAPDLGAAGDAWQAPCGPCVATADPCAVTLWLTVDNLRLTAARVVQLLLAWYGAR
ncbi:MAG: hypothetical protein KC613_00505 [Myxococcales bacterium]|nr:hypothetical protein [Myxococcales bacterium]MCB9526220.1 hypothetical protein [Myxococcales bacterium]